LFGAPYDEERYKKGVLHQPLYLQLVADTPKFSTNVRWRRTLSYLKRETKRKWARKG